MNPLTISQVAVRQDASGRYCLNDLHRAAMARGTATISQRPGTFMKRPETAALVAAIKKRCTGQCIDPVWTVKGGPQAEQGTFVSKTLVIAYAMWIDADFHLDVIEAFDSMQTASLGLWQQLQAAIAQEVESKVRASFGSHLMLERKKEKAPLLARIESLNAEIQPALPLH